MPCHCAMKGGLVGSSSRTRVLAVVLLAVLLLWVLNGLSGVDSQTTYSEFRDAVEAGDVEEVTIQGQSLEGVFKPEGDEQEGEQFATTLPPPAVVGDQGLEPFLLENGVRITARPD